MLQTLEYSRHTLRWPPIIRYIHILSSSLEFGQTLRLPSGLQNLAKGTGCHSHDYTVSLKTPAQSAPVRFSCWLWRNKLPCFERIYERATWEVLAIETGACWQPGKKKKNGDLSLLPQGTELLSKTTQRRREVQARQSTALSIAWLQPMRSWAENQPSEVMPKFLTQENCEVKEIKGLLF